MPKKDAENFAGSLALSFSIAMIGLSIGAVISHYLGRVVFREWALDLRDKNPLFHALDDAMVRDGVKLSALLRTSLPLLMVNYGLAVSSLPFHKFCLGLCGHIPWCVVYSWLGCTLDSLLDVISGGESEEAAAARAWGGLCSLVLTAVVLTFITQRAIRKVVKHEKENLDSRSDSDNHINVTQRDNDS